MDAFFKNPHATQVYYAMAFYVLHIWVIAMMNFRLRVGSVKRGEVKGRYFKAYQGDAPERVIILGRHLDNQFQAPLLFFITCFVVIQSGAVNSFTVVLAWLFNISRMGHSFMHLGKNHPLHRAYCYGAGWFIIFVMWSQIILSTF